MKLSIKNRFSLFILITILLFGIVCFFYLRSQRPYNVVLISIDTLGPDHLGCYGYHRNTSPTIDRLAREGVRFETVVSTTTWTLPAHIALLTSLPDIVHGLVLDYKFKPLDKNRITLAEVFKQKGYQTGGVFTTPYLLPMFGFSQGFDEYLDATLYDKRLAKSDVRNASQLGRTTPGAVDKVEAWLDRRDPRKPFFLFLHLFDVHQDFDPPPPYDTMFGEKYSGDISNKGMGANPVFEKPLKKSDLDHFIALYDGEIRFVDEKGVARLIKILEKRKLLDNTLIVITSDHGEEFREHGTFGHRTNLYDTTLLIPLIFWQPKLTPQGKVVKKQVRIIDIMPTIIDLANLPQGAEMLGKTMVPLMENEDMDEGEPRWALAELYGFGLNMEALRSDKFKIILDHEKKKIEYFYLEKDKTENRPVTDIENKDLQRALDFFKVFRKAMLTCRKAIPWENGGAIELDNETKERLKSLGYLE